ncbi:21042_t:CDS:2 [Entrophospora sp. SA101]|nr:21042_t:CDS:2 [Entrophospora sp. SA101]
MLDPQNKLSECLRQINDDNNNENLESSTTQQPISNFYEITLLTKKCNDYINWALIKAFENSSSTLEMRFDKQKH